MPTWQGLRRIPCWHGCDVLGTGPGTKSKESWLTESISSTSLLLIVVPGKAEAQYSLAPQGFPQCLRAGISIPLSLSMLASHLSEAHVLCLSGSCSSQLLPSIWVYLNAHARKRPSCSLFRGLPIGLPYTTLQVISYT